MQKVLAGDESKPKFRTERTKKCKSTRADPYHVKQRERGEEHSLVKDNTALGICKQSVEPLTRRSLALPLQHLCIECIWANTPGRMSYYCLVAVICKRWELHRKIAVVIVRAPTNPAWVQTTFSCTCVNMLRMCVCKHNRHLHEMHNNKKCWKIKQLRRHFSVFASNQRSWKKSIISAHLTVCYCCCPVTIFLLHSCVCVCVCVHITLKGTIYSPAALAPSCNVAKPLFIRTPPQPLPGACLYIAQAFHLIVQISRQTQTILSNFVRQVLVLC